MPSRELVIDGYNLIFRLARDAEFRPGEIKRLRAELEAACSRYGRSRGVRPWIVYDGRNVNGSHAGAREQDHLKVSYADPPAEADDLICQVAGQIRAEGRHVEVVTSDAGLAERVRDLGAEIVPVEIFHERLGTDRPRLPPRVEDIESHFLALADEAAERACPGGEGRAPVAGSVPQIAGEGGDPDLTAPDPAPRKKRGRRRQQRRLEALRRRTGKARKRRR